MNGLSAISARLAGNGSPATTAESVMSFGDQKVRIRYVRNPRARRYVLRVNPDATARVTVPRNGSLPQATAFVERQRSWLEKHLARLAARPKPVRAWIAGTEVLFRGVSQRVSVSPDGTHVHLGDQIVAIRAGADDFRPVLERHLWKLAAKELPARVHQLAAADGLNVRRVTVRNQRSRWGSCSRLATISLNWRIIQAPEQVRDYLIHHELMHLRQMNHSKRFWAEVERVCPDYRTAEAWLKTHAGLLR